MTTEDRPIVVGINDSSDARAAVHWAIAEARVCGCAVVLTHTWIADSYSLPAIAGAIPDGTLTGAANREIQGAAQAWLDTTVLEVAAQAPVPVSGALGEGSAAGFLLSLAPSASMLVVGSRGHSTAARWMTGSTSAQVAHHCPIPVVVVREGDKEQNDRPTANFCGPVVVGVDGSASSLAALRAAHEFAAEHHLALQVVHSWQPPLSGTLMGNSESFDLSTAAQFDEGWRTLHESLSALQTSTPVVPMTEQLQRGSAAAALIAASQQASLTVVGARGRGGFLGLLLGSVSSAVLHHAHSPVMIVR
ncbi:MAG TPA: universal stress protein UspA [Actinobacteria bacterium]|nr:universal stress protein UspA [Actinomycetota bacterium]